MIFTPIKLSLANTPVAQDTAAPNNGAPGPLNDLVAVNDPTYGLQLLHLIYNSTGATIPQGAMTRADAVPGLEHDADLTTADDAKVLCRGTALVAIPNAHFGYVVARGYTQYLPDAATADAGLLICKSVGATDGRLDDPLVAGLEHAIVGYSIGIGAAGVLQNGYIDVL